MDAKKLLNKKSKTTSTSHEVIPTNLTTPAGVLKRAPGSSLSLGQLHAQATKLIQSARQLAAELTAVHWPPAMTDAVEANLVKVDEIISSVPAATAKLTTAEYRATGAKSIAFQRRLVAKLRVAALAKPGILTTMPLTQGRPRNAQDLVKWYASAQRLMEALRTELSSISSVDWFTALKNEEVALNTALGLQGQSQAQRAAHAEERRAARNALALSVQALYLHARDAFIDNPSLLKQFQKSSGKKTKAKPQGKTAKAAKGGDGAAGATPAAAPQPAVGEKAKALLN